MEGLWSRVTDQGRTCAVASFQMGHPGTIPLPAPCSLGNYNSSKKEDALSKLEEVVGRQGRLWSARRALALPQQKLA